MDGILVLALKGTKMKLLAGFLLGLIFFCGSAFGQQKIVALTFDDGPNPEFLKGALVLFEQEKIPVTFFVIGANVGKYPDLVSKEFFEGHEVENHTYGHVCLVKPSDKWTGCCDLTLVGAVRELMRTNKSINSVTGYYPKYVRPPYFAMTKKREAEIRRELGMDVIGHGVDSIGSLDWVYSSSEKIVLQVESVAKQRGMKSFVVVFHERLVTLEALPQLINFFRNAGYKFVRLDEYESAKNGKGRR